MKQIIISIFSLCLSLTAFGWGQTGHRVVGKVAENHLSEKAKEALWKIMGHESLAEASTWMDEIKSDNSFDYANPWHYVTIPEGKNYHTAEHPEEGDAYEAINRMKSILKDEKASKEEKRNAVRMLTHLVGDMHQPLHVGNGEDRGGNNVKLKWFYDDSNLHRVWDSEIIDSKQLSYTELAQMIDHYKEAEQDTVPSTDMNVWINEAMMLRTQVYNIGDKNYLSYEYMYQNWDTVKNQLYKAGVRLAQVLNEIYA